MKTSEIGCEVLTPMFSAGYDKRKAEYRVTEVKALMRYTFRIANHAEKINELFKQERQWFGGASEEGKKRITASPLRLTLDPTERLWFGNGREKLLLHGNKKNMASQPCFMKDTSITFNVRTSQNLLEQKPPISYENLLQLSFLLGGLGKRSRKGRGNVAVLSVKRGDGEVQSALHKSKGELLTWILNQLNALSGDGTFLKHGNKIVLKYDKSLYRIARRRPILYQITVGECMEDVMAFLKAIDETCHESKKGKNMNVLGFAGRDCRFASALIIGVVRIGPDLYPIYTQVSEVHSKYHRENAGEKWPGEFECVEFMKSLGEEMKFK